MGKKILKISMLVLLLFFTITNIVDALSCTATMTPSSTNVAEGQEFIVTLKINNMDAGSSEGFSSISGTLKYDNTVFETIGQSSFDKLNNWNPTFDAETNKLTLRSSIAAKTDTSICQITFKVKSEIKKTQGKATTGTIKFDDIVATTANADDTAVSSIQTTITVGQSSNNNNGNMNAANSNVVNIARNETPDTPSYVNDVNKTEEDMPHTGAEDTAFVLLVAVVIVGIIFYIKFERLSSDIK